MGNTRKAEETAAERVRMIAPLLEEGLDPAALAGRKREVCERHGVSERTLRRYLGQYREGGFAGLKPMSPGRPGLRSIPPEALAEAVQLRREVPGRSVRSIIQILEWEGKIEAGSVRRSTLQDHLVAAGYSSSQMRIYRESGVAARRFQRSHRNSLWQSDIKYGPHVNGAQTFMAAFIDDCTRRVLHAEFYPTLDQSIVEDAFRQSLQGHGAPKAVYFDNGKQYRTRVMERACAKLGVRLLYARPYAAESKGKIERFNRTVDGFLAEIQIGIPRDLGELNRKFWAWLDECCQYRPHSALDGGMSPFGAYQADSEPIRFIDSSQIAEAFLRVEKRKVDKSGCISFGGRKYEIERGLLLIGRGVDVVYDASDTGTLWVEHEGFPRSRAKPLAIGERAGQRPALPAAAARQGAPAASRLLDAAEARNGGREKQRKAAISFRGMEGAPNV
jgi:transposase InsO family protein